MLFPDFVPATTLTGIAKHAAQADLLEAKRSVEYLELPTRAFIGRCSAPYMPFAWTINPYRGCEFGCKYCYARYTHEFMELRDPLQFEEKIFAKQWNERAFQRELARIPRAEPIAIGTATDPYQPAERRYGVTRRILEVFAHERGRHFSLVTKSDLVAKDAGVFREIARANVLHVNLTITTVDEELARMLEPRAPRPALRLAAVRKLSEAGLKVGVLPNPILPLITDSFESLDALARAAKEAGAAALGGRVVFLKPCSQRVFFPFLREKFPHLLRRYEERFKQSAFLRGDYPKKIEQRLRTIRDRHGLSARWPEYQPELWDGDPQMELFGEFTLQHKVEAL